MQRMKERPNGGLLATLARSITLGCTLSFGLVASLATPLAHSAGEVAQRPSAALRKLPDLPELQMADQNSAGSVQGNLTVSPNQRWMLLVLDVANAESQVMLNALEKRAGGFHDRIHIVVTGQSKQISAFMSRNQSLQGVRWVQDQDKSLVKRLQLKVQPAMYALNGKNEIVWQILGNPKHGSILQMVNNWLAIPFNADKANLAK